MKPWLRQLVQQLILMRTNWKLSLKNWKLQSWRNSFFSLQPWPLLIQFRSQRAEYQLVLLLRNIQRKTNLPLCKQKWHSKQVKITLFNSIKRDNKTVIGLMQLAQDKDKLLKDFIAWFSRVTLEIKDLQMCVVVTAMMNGTRSHLLKMSFSKNSPNTMDELLRRGDKYMDAEEAFFIIKVGGINSTWKNYAQASRSTLVDKNERFSQNITFSDEDLKSVTCPHDDALVIVADIADFDVEGVLVDNGSAANVMFWEVFLGLKISPSKIKPITTPLHGFGGATVIPERTIHTKWNH
ncbi:Ribonuclease H [Abeliophyllum distichum]|uniref:Ribonuclease H n=1 Tax=Abeliophyllum distichum TaxID=126358 RepID=A0ABD1RQQ5_9LAMI